MKLNHFNFRKFEDKILMTNDFGDHLFLDSGDFRDLISGRIQEDSTLGKALLAKRMTYLESDLAFSSAHRYDLREAKGFLQYSTSLHIFVVTTSCNMNCVYCRAVELALQSPTKYLSFEFQGGEPLLNFKIIRHIVEYAEARKGEHCVEYNVVTNLTLLTDEMLSLFSTWHFGISTSLDGPPALHDRNRPFPDGSGTFHKLTTAIQKVREAGISVGAIETTTRASLQHPVELVETYQKMGFDSIFIRPLTPLGKALRRWDSIGYTPEEFVRFYQKVLDKLIEVNKSGRFMKESHAAIFLSRIEGRSVNYMELRSPCGAATGQMAYYPDGLVFTCDEARMLYEMGTDSFMLGNVFQNTYQDLILSGVSKTVCASSILETLPTCCDCVYQPYCGTCPVVNYAMTNDIVEKSPRGYRCRIYSGILDHLFSLFLRGDEETIAILRSWSD